MLAPNVFSVKWSDAQWQVKLAVQTQSRRQLKLDQLFWLQTSHQYYLCTCSLSVDNVINTHTYWADPEIICLSFISEYVNTTFRTNTATMQGRKVHIPPTDSTLF